MRFGLLTCKEALAQMSAYLDRTLTPTEMLQVKRHVRICHACALKFAAEERLLEETRTKMERIQPEDTMISRLSTILAEASRLS